MTPPRTSLILLACNQQGSVRAAAESCLAQTGEPLEIVFSDDASSDATFEVLRGVAAAYRGPHQVRARRNACNLGIGAHYNQLMRETRGDLIVTAAGDDLSVPERVQCIVDAWDAGGRRADLIASHYRDMAPDGSPGPVVATDDLGALTLARWCEKRPFTVGATHAFTRRMMERFGPFIADLWYEDPVMALRAVLSGGALTIARPLVHYRRGGTSKWPRVRRGDELVAWVGTQNRRVLAEIRQHTLDARLAGAGDAVGAALEPTLRRETYLAAMLGAETTASRWRACRAASSLPLGWRLRKFLTFTFPDQAAGLKHFNARRRGR